MSMHVSNVCPKLDKVLTDIADYVANHRIRSRDAYNTARLCLLNSARPDM